MIKGLQNTPRNPQFFVPFIISVPQVSQIDIKSDSSNVKSIISVHMMAVFLISMIYIFF